MESNLIRFEHGRIDTIYDLFCERVRRTPDKVAYRYFDADKERWKELTWMEMAGHVGRRSEQLRSWGAKAGDRCAILSANSPFWVCADQAAASLKMITVPLFYNDREENMAQVIRHAQVRFLIIRQEQQWQLLQPHLQDSCLEKVILAESFELIWSNDHPEKCEQVEVPENLATIIYTSGTTGFPKGVMLTHKNILENARGANAVSNVYPEDLFLSFLPLSHAFERTVGYYLPMMAGSTVAFARSVLTLQEDLVTIQPTMLVTVPRMFEKVNARFSEKLASASALMQGLVALAEKLGYSNFERRQGRKGWYCGILLFPLLDKLVGSKVRKSLGGRLRVAVSGGAPLAPSIARRFLGFGIPIIQGYGLTECSPVVSSNSLESNQPASVGDVLIETEVRTDSETGELLVKGPGIMLGYWRQPEATAEVIDKDGWFHTGDIARIEEGKIYITGRIKDIIVLSNGENLPPTDVEEAIALDPWIDQVMVVGEGRPFLTALIVPSELGKDADKQTMLSRISKAMHAFPGYEKVKDIIICQEPWTVEDGQLTPTMKLRRQKVLEQFSNEIEQLYS